MLFRSAEADGVISASTPIGSMLKVGVALARSGHQGFGRNLNLGIDNYSKDVWAARGTIEFTSPDERLFVRITGDYTDDKSDPRNGHRLIPGLLSGAPVLANVFDTRAGLNFPLHPMADMLFNPLAKPGDADYGNLYISVGDGTSGERAGPTHPIPQRLDALPGKILRITPDITLRPNDMLNINERYRVPSSARESNPFVTVKGARPEIFAYGLRNPHRISWDTVTNTLISADIGDHSWEELNIIVKGGNYGWALREGPELRFTGGPNGGLTATQIDPPVPYPAEDVAKVEGLDRPVPLIPPAGYYSHHDGLAIGSGYVYRGTLLPQLTGKYVFTEITTGRLFYADLAALIANQGKRVQSVPINEIEIA